MKAFKRFATGFILALLLVFTLNSRAEAVADFKACWLTGASDNSIVVIYFTFVGDDVYSINMKGLNSVGDVDLAGSGTMVFGTTEVIGSAAVTSINHPGVMTGEMITLTLDLATLILTIEDIATIYDRITTLIGTGFGTLVLTMNDCP